MPLKLEFKSGDKLMINGAVIENIGTNAKILVHNEAAILRNKEVLSKTDEATPAARVYFSLQCAYMFPDHADDHMKTFGDHLNDYVQACPSAKGIAQEIQNAVADGKIYKALKKTHNLISHEANVLQQFHHDLASYVEQEHLEEDENTGDEIENVGEKNSKAP
ncbi:MAG: flagellar biosynthesis repressor FlbT [Magnetovibrio sp.]|nr:flagellar biosynthesis repressor FlbT [Magnetovibrio sp.]